MLIGFPGMSYFEVVASAMFFQFSLYISVRLAHRGFTFGELGLVAFGATVLFMELVNLTIAKVCSHLAIIAPSSQDAVACLNHKRSLRSTQQSAIATGCSACR